MPSLVRKHIIIKKNGKTYRYKYWCLTKSVREGDKIIQKYVKYLGKEKPSKKELEKIISSL